MGIQKQIGNNAEKKVLDYFTLDEWWVHLFAYSTSGQPCDIIAIKGNTTILADVKHCDTDIFRFSRVESNQDTCLQYAKDCGIENVGFILVYDIQLYWLPYTLYKQLAKNGVKQITTHGLSSLNDYIKGL